ncbi:MAG: copper chaperone [Chryseobacterium sp.]|nr:MAG: copper chaperone [Chryseobacterium sp.]
MEKINLKFKTNLNCQNCVKAVTEPLNGCVGEGNWQVDTNHEDRVLHVFGDQKVTKEQVVDAVRDAGFEIEPLE